MKDKSRFPTFEVETDMGDITCYHSWAQFIQKNYITESPPKLVKMVDELRLWSDVG
ncbi:hypothetical protein LCGC14_3159290, partial [marine sediment metagenome]